MTFLVAESTGLGGLFTALGLNLQTFVLDMIAFLVTAWVVGKYVFPPLTKALDAKKAELEAAVRLENEATGKLDEAKDDAAKLIQEARAAADEILATAKTDAATQLEAAQKKAAEQGERMLGEAREQLARDVLSARKQLKSESAELVATATEALLGEKLDGKHDHELISRSLDRG